jgi:uncharacterized membrane protein
MASTFILILLIVLLILLIQFKNDFNKQMGDLRYKVNLLLLKKPVTDEKEDIATTEPVVVRQERVYKPKEEPPVTALPVAAFVEPVTTFEQPPTVPTEPEKTITEPETESVAAFEGLVPKALPKEPTTPFKEHTPPEPSFWEKNPDLEKFIGENLFNKIGIGVLVLGIGYFLKFAIDKNWINEIGRTFIGLICGGILIGIAHRMRKTFTAFSSVLVGGGVAVLYFTMTIAFQQYHLINQTVAFLMMIVITAFTVVLSLSYDRKELAILAILGGFSSPFLVSTGAGSAAVLFSYILILNVGMLVLAYYKKWNIVNIISYIATVILFGSWLTYSIQGETAAKPVPYVTALVFATLFYIVFFLMNVVNNIKLKAKFKAGEIIILLSNTFFYYASGMVILQHVQHGLFQGLFTAFIAVFNFIFAYSLYRNEKADRNLIYLLIGLVLSFMSLAAPVQLDGNYITLFWAIESVLLLWLYQKSGIQLMKYAAALVLGLMSISLLMDWTQLYADKIYPLRPVFNRGFITGVMSIAAVLMLRKLLKKEEQEFIKGLPIATCRQVLGLASIAMIYVVVILELNYQSNVYWPASTMIVTGAFNYLFVAAMLYMSRKEVVLFRGAAIMLAGAAMLAYIAYNTQVIILRDQFLTGKLTKGHFLFHYVLIALLLTMVYQTYLTMRSLAQDNFMHIFQWCCTTAILYVLSASLDHIVVIAAYKPPADIYNIVTSNQKTGYAILWGMFAFVLIYLGFKWQSRQIRIISISVFALTLLKLFVFDLRGLSEGGKIAAFISLGVLLLIISFMYQRLKKILLTDDK